MASAPLAWQEHQGKVLAPLTCRQWHNSWCRSAALEDCRRLSSLLLCSQADKRVCAGLLVLHAGAASVQDTLSRLQGASSQPAMQRQGLMQPPQLRHCLVLADARQPDFLARWVPNSRKLCQVAVRWSGAEH